MLVEIWTVKAILMKSRMETRNELLTTEKGHAHYQAARSSAELPSCPSVLGEVEKIGCLAEVLSKQSAEGVA